MSDYSKFIFKDYRFDKDSKTLELNYSYDDKLELTEKYRFDFEFTDYNEKSLDLALSLLFLVAGVSYFKSYLAPTIEVRKGYVTKSIAGFLAKTYRKGLGEFFFMNKLDPRMEFSFPINTESLVKAPSRNNGGKIVGIGGGKDSLVTVEMLKDEPNIYTFSVNHRHLLQPLIERIGLPHLWIEREIDPKMPELNKSGAYNGHVPFSGILACVGLVAAVLSGNRDVVVSNESSASEPTMIYEGEEINHQYSKSFEFEVDFQQLINGLFEDSLRYYSILRPLSELHIAKLFARDGFAKYKKEFSSCNRAFVNNHEKLYWCGECAKCAFVFLALTPFIPREELESLWNKNLLLDPSLQSTYEQLLGVSGDKPLDCVGEIKESRTAMRLAQQIYPELSEYRFDIPEDYDYLKLAVYSMPDDVFKTLKDFIA